ncbi:hypothetical protein Aple_068830 [Acrocarpospora pleiomorpha]|uniref:Uncharacterized protein n=1 Tax=Acrocarpospora pleiomorpha TaxID=90975 RepID=A0A5M3XRW6_9ACTN|nr:hypothetical protein Aple_068830 [Acrocarpospora pleiomorpha]
MKVTGWLSDGSPLDVRVLITPRNTESAEFIRSVGGGAAHEQAKAVPGSKTSTPVSRANTIARRRSMPLKRIPGLEGSVPRTRAGKVAGNSDDGAE